MVVDLDLDLDLDLDGLDGDASVRATFILVVFGLNQILF